MQDADARDVAVVHVLGQAWKKRDACVSDEAGAIRHDPLKRSERF